MKVTLISASGYKYKGPHTFASPEAALEYLRAKFDDPEIRFETDPHEECAASFNIITMLCGNTKTVANAVID